VAARATWALLVTVLAVGVASAWAAPGTTVLVSGGCVGSSASQVALSADGRVVAFQCKFERGPYEVFLRDLSSGHTTLVSRASGADGEQGNANSGSPSLSADGRYVAFWSRATNLTPEDADQHVDVFVRDLASGTTTLVSRATGEGGAKENDEASSAPSISADGDRVAFNSKADNLSPDDADHRADVFVRDLRTNVTTLVSRADGAQGVKSDGSSFSGPSISGDGRRVAFESSARNLSPAQRNGQFDVFVRDLPAATTTLVTRASGAHGAKLDGLSYDPAISADGRIVAFAFQRCPERGTAFDCPPIRHIYVRDLITRTTTLVDRANGAHGARADDGSGEPSISADGRLVAFDSDATNLARSPSYPQSNVFVRDLRAHTTGLVSRPNGSRHTMANADSYDPSLAHDGRFVGFDSHATNLTRNGRHGGAFVRELAPRT
jgi:Tol biopolymer transport system component